jgi:flagellar hook assembly protein FlgD
LSLSAYPNPFHTFTNLKVDLSQQKQIRDASIQVYNIKGQILKSIQLSAKSGEQISVWDGMDENGRICASGVYIMNLMINGKKSASQKVTFLK